MRTIFTKFFFFLFLTLLASSSLMAQQEITGKVLDEKNEPLVGVTVLIKGTSKGTVTNLNGEYTITAPTGAILTFSFIGYMEEDVEVGSQTSIEVTLIPDLLSLQEVVVTALGIKREKKALGYSVQEVKASELTQTSDANIVTSLQGKVAGVQINETGAGVGGSSRIEIRGASSLSDNNKPLIVVDGVPFNTGSTFIDLNTNSSDEQAGIWGGLETSGGLADIDPQDIETISVLKGPNAAALYGSRAGNGVIMITTKKGKIGGVNIDYNGSVAVSNVVHQLDMQDVYGQGQEGVYDPNSTVSWGPKMEGQLLPSWTGDTIPYTAQTGRIDDFTRSALSQNHSLSFSAGTEKGTLRASITKVIENGIYEDHKVDKTNFNIRADYNITKWLQLDTKVSYFLTQGEERPQVGYYSYMPYFYGMPMNIRTQDLAPGYEIAPNGDHVEKLYTTVNAGQRNPYFMQEQHYNDDKRYRTFGYLGASIKFSENFRLKIKYGLDFHNENKKDGYRYTDNISVGSYPNYNTHAKFFKEENTEFLFSYNKVFGDFDLSLNAGGNRMYTFSRRLSGHSGYLPSEGNLFLGFGTNISSTEDFREQEVQSLYTFGRLGYKDMVYIDVTARNDWSSTLPSNNNSYFYPSFSLSAILSEMVALPDWFTFAKIRGSYAGVGKATEPYNTNELFTVVSGNFELLDARVVNVRVNKDLKPELSYSTEFGGDLRFLNNRIGIDFTYYNEQTKNQILRVETDESSGYIQKLLNAGLISNKGVEILLNTKPVNTSDFKLNVDINFTKNTSVLEELDKDLKEFEFTNSILGAEVVGIEGEKLGDIKGSRYARDENNNIIVDRFGLPTGADSSVVVGNIQADFQAGISISADYKGFFLSALITMQQGGNVFSVTEMSATGSGTAARTTENDRMSFFYEGVTADGQENDVMISAQEYWGRVAGITEEFIYDASHMKLREVAIGYRLPATLLSKIPGKPFKKAKLTVFGRNLFYFYKHTPGTVPDASAQSSGFAGQAYDFSPVPTARTLGFSLNLGF